MIEAMSERIHKLLLSSVILLFVLITGCFRNVCPDQPIYQVFTKDEIANNLWINIDSALNLQQKLIINKNYSQYDELDTLNFIDEKNDTIPILIHNNIQPAHSLCTDYPMDGNSSIYPLKPCFIKGFIYKMEKSIVSGKPIDYSFDFEWDNGNYGSSFVLNDTLKFEFGFTNNIVDKTKITYVIPSIASITINSITIDKCIKFLFLDKSKNEILVTYYSNKYGYVKIIKNKQNEITRIL